MPHRIPRLLVPSPHFVARCAGAYLLAVLAGCAHPRECDFAIPKWTILGAELRFRPHRTPIVAIAAPSWEHGRATSVEEKGTDTRLLLCSSTQPGVVPVMLRNDGTVDYFVAMLGRNADRIQVTVPHWARSSVPNRLDLLARQLLLRFGNSPYQEDGVIETLALHYVEVRRFVMGLCLLDEAAPPLVIIGTTSSRNARASASELLVDAIVATAQLESRSLSREEAKAALSGACVMSTDDLTDFEWRSFADRHEYLNRHMRRNYRFMWSAFSPPFYRRFLIVERSNPSQRPGGR